MKNIKKFFKNQKGFSLVELIIVIAILAVIAGIAAPNLIGYVQRSRVSADESNATLIANAILVELADRGGNTYSTGGDANSTVEFRQYTPAEANANPDRTLINDAIGNLQNVPTQKVATGNFYIKIENGKVSVYRGSDTTSLKVYPN
ncbi:type IV pilus assembly protein PilA [Natranaerovirga pectinivora]|uniref:Type IV pilus assembly protein PilA n=1 Tax=Natranaerovirga pectinivora TaxID=682400 RepID=A0A4R3MNP7_9FIRM|nr:prepilin-type N-terminal cleavage/methylation domain-containing protein [Natranaerovirga pectinivora]TCT16895.1 type IV pilus assembly protein PilA [Natranaerovirga pectinivora]